jgi:transposase InsO family protein
LKLWLSAAEIAALQLPGLPARRESVIRFADRNGWNARADLARTRAGRGGGMEYHYQALPADARAAYVARHVETIDIPASVAREAAQDDESIRLDGPATDSRDARLALLAVADRYAADAQLSHWDADARFAALFNAGQIEVAGWIKAEVRSLTARTLRRWRKIRSEAGAARLAVDRAAVRRGTGLLDRANEGEVKTYILALVIKQPQLTAEHIRKVVADRFSTFDLAGRSVDVPPVRTFQYALKAWREDYRNEIEAVRNPDRFKSTIRFSARVAQPASHLNEVWQIDASPADVMCVDGRHAVYVAIDVYSRRMIGLVSKTPRASAVGLLVRKCILTWGVPERIKSDNGSDFIARETQRLFAALAIEHETARAFSPEQKGHVERAIGTLQRGLMRTLPGFVGHSVADRKAIESRKSFAARLGEAPEDTFAVSLTGTELQARVDEWCNNVYATAPHAGLKGQTPFAVAAMASGPAVRRIEDERALDVLLMPVAGKNGIRVVTKSGIRTNDTYYLGGFLTVGDEVLVRMDPADMGRAHAFTPDGGTYLGEVIAPELAGIDPVKAIAAAKAEQKRIMAERFGAAKKEARRIRAADMAPAIARQAAREAGKLAEFPKRTETHDTPALAAARRAAEGSDIEPVHSADIVALAEQLRHEPINVKPLRTEETPHHRWRRARAIEEAMARGEAVNEDELLWLGGYRTGPEYRGFALTYGIPETKSPAGAAGQGQ